MNFAQQLKDERSRLDLTQAKAASILSISKSTLEKWENGTKTPKELTQEGALARLAQLKTKTKKGSGLL